MRKSKSKYAKISKTDGFDEEMTICGTSGLKKLAPVPLERFLIIVTQNYSTKMCTKSVIMARNPVLWTGKIVEIFTQIRISSRRNGGAKKCSLFVCFFH